MSGTKVIRSLRNSREFWGQVTIVQLPDKQVKVPDYCDVSYLGNYLLDVVTCDLVPLSGQVYKGTYTIESSGNRTERINDDNYVEISWELSLSFKVQKSHYSGLGQDTIVVNGGHYKKVMKEYYRAAQNAPYYLSRISEENAPTLNLYDGVNNYWYAYGEVCIHGVFDGMIRSNKEYDWEGKMTNQYSENGEGIFAMGLYFKDSKALNMVIRNGGKVVSGDGAA